MNPFSIPFTPVRLTSGCLRLCSLLVLSVLLSASTLTLGQSPTVNMTFPQFNSSYFAGTNINIRATATTPTSTTITKVEFFFQENFAGGYTKIGEDLTAPYSMTWTAPSPTQTARSYQVRAVVTNSTSATAVNNPSTTYNAITIYSPGYVSTRNWFVSAVASSTNTAGSEASPFNTIQKAADRVAPGDTVFVMAGTYTGTGTNIISVQRTGSPTRPIVFMPYKTDKPVVQLGNNNFQGFNVLPAAAYIKIQGFEIIGNNASVTLPEALTQPGSCAVNKVGTVLAKFNGNGMLIDGRNGENLHPHHITLTQNNIHDCGGAGIGAIEADYVTIDYNTTYNNSWYTIFGSSGISIFHPWNFDTNTGYRNYVRNNKSYGNRLDVPWVTGCKITDGNGIIIDDFPNSQSSSTIRGQVYTGRTLVANNVVFNNGGSGIHAFKGLSTDIINNTSYLNSQSQGVDMPIGEIYAQQSDDMIITNNIIRPITGEPTFTTEALNTNVIYSSNLYLVDDAATQLPNQTAGNTVRDNIVVTPSSETAVFVSPSTSAATADFQLKAGSSAVNAGVSTFLSSVATDFMNTPRPQGSGVDIGAYELLMDNPAALFAIAGVTTVSCSTVGAGLRSVSFTPQYAGLSGQPVSFLVVNELPVTASPGPYTLNLYTDNPVVTLKAVQTGTPNEVTFSYNWLAACSGSGRLGIEDSYNRLQVSILGNPVREHIVVEIRGENGQLVKLQLTDSKGFIVESRSVEQGIEVEQQVFELRQQATGILFLRVSTMGQTRTFKLLKL